MGYPVSAFRQYPQSNYNQISYNLAWYVQDNWHVTPNLTLNLGLRYEYDTWPVDSRNQVTSFDPAIGKFVVGQSPDRSPTLLLNRLAALAWQLFGNLMVKAGDVGLPTRTLRVPGQKQLGSTGRARWSTAVPEKYGIPARIRRLLRAGKRKRLLEPDCHIHPMDHLARSNEYAAGADAR